MEFTNREKKIIDTLVGLKKKSPSHDLDHSIRVVEYATKLAKIYGGKREIIVPACLLHDLGRVKRDLHGRDQATESARMARSILARCGYGEEEIETITRVIAEHDQPDLSPTTLEGKILKDADFLDGFGARGILRATLWAGERGETEEEVVRRLKEKMWGRVKGLEFPESREAGLRLYRFVQFFLSLLDEKFVPDPAEIRGKYIVFEGISGSGKETQARRIFAYLQEKGIKARLVFEPSPDTKPILRKWQSEVDDRLMELLLFTADRRRIVQREVLPALEKGEMIVNVRSYISTLVYETETPSDEALVSFLHTFVPRYDLIFLLDIEPSLAMRRIETRHEERGEPISKFEKLERLKRDRIKYKKVFGDLENVVVLDGEQSIEKIHREILRILKERRIINES